MKDYPILKTTLPFLQLQPLTKKHLPFIVSLLSSPEIQKTLFRIPTRVSIDKEEKALERMYEHALAKEITYILTIKKLFSEKYIGYVKIKLIDWAVKSCYLSVAILPDQEYRGKGYAKATYQSFFDYLFSLGIMKIYGRTYETNTPTILLNKATGFDFIGRQTDFILYPNGTSLDALLFERKNPILQTKFQKPYQHSIDALVQILVPLIQARRNGKITPQLLESTLSSLKNTSWRLDLLQPLQTFMDEVVAELEHERQQSSSAQQIDPHSDLTEFITNIRAENASAANLELLAYPITEKQTQKTIELSAFLHQLLNTENEEKLSEINLDIALTYGAYTPENWIYLEPLFLGKSTKTSASAAIIKIKNRV